MDYGTPLKTRIIALVAQHTSVRPETISLETTLQYDLGLDGLDAVELLETFGDNFSVDLSDIPFDRYFGPEAGTDPVTLLVALIRRTRPRREEITIGDLVHAAKAGRWLKDS